MNRYTDKYKSPHITGTAIIEQGQEDNGMYWGQLSSFDGINKNMISGIVDKTAASIHKWIDEIEKIWDLTLI